jgi:hypothetical protein
MPHACNASLDGKVKGYLIPFAAVLRACRIVAVVALAAIACPALVVAQQRPAAPAEAALYVGAEAVARTGERLGTVDNVLVGSDGQARAVLIKARLFLGLVECRMAVPWERITAVEAGDQRRRLVLDMTRREFNAMPEWDQGQAGSDLRPL